MVVSKENLSDLKERYEKAQKLFDEEAKLDPITNPYRSAYAAREILREMELNLTNILADLGGGSDEGVYNNREDIFVYKCILAIVLKDLSRNFTTTEEISEGSKYLTNAIELLDTLHVRPETVVTYVECYNEKGLLATSNEVSVAMEYFDKAEDVYTNFKNLGQDPLTIYDIFGTKDEVEIGKGMLSLEKNYTLTLYYKAQVYTKLEDLHNSAWCCHKTLKRQLEFKDFDPLEWGLNAAVLSQYFFSHHKFTESRHHLAAANLMFDNYRLTMITDVMTEEQKTAALEKFNHNYADLMRCCGKYGLYILLSSKERLMADEAANNLTDLWNLKIYSEDLKFETLDVAHYESQITDKYCLTFDDAKKVFLKVQDWFNKAKEYYTSDGEATEHAKIIQDLSSSYSLLAFFEEDSSNQCKLHKRRADLLEDIVKLYNPNYYINICREVWYELSLLYSNMLDIKLDILNDQTITERPTPHALNKINQLCDKSIKNFNEFLDSYRSKQTCEIPMSTLNFEDRQSILVAYFHIGRLYYKKITPDKLLNAKNINDSLKYYDLFVKSCSESKDTEASFKAEIGVCREMIELLPRKLALLMEEIRQESSIGS